MNYFSDIIMIVLVIIVIYVSYLLGKSIEAEKYSRTVNTEVGREMLPPYKRQIKPAFTEYCMNEMQKSSLKYTQGIISGAQIIKEIQAGNIVITDFDPKRLNPNSYNVRLDSKLLVYDLKPGECLDMKKKNPTKVIDLNDYPEGYVLQPGVLYLGSTMETAGCKHHLVPMLAGRSSIARLGMGSDYFAAFGDVGFGSKPGVKWTYEITVVHPLKVYAGVEIAQVYFLTLAGEELSSYGETGKYANNTGVEASKLYKDFEN